MKNRITILGVFLATLFVLPACSEAGTEIDGHLCDRVRDYEPDMPIKWSEVESIYEIPLIRGGKKSCAFFSGIEPDTLLGEIHEYGKIEGVPYLIQFISYYNSSGSINSRFYISYDENHDVLFLEYGDNPNYHWNIVCRNSFGFIGLGDEWPTHCRIEGRFLELSANEMVADRLTFKFPREEIGGVLFVGNDGVPIIDDRLTLKDANADFVLKALLRGDEVYVEHPFGRRTDLSLDTLPQVWALTNIVYDRIEEYLPTAAEEYWSKSRD